MLRYRIHGTQGTSIVLLHWLGGSARTWTEVATGLAARGFRCIALDLPGFGDAVANPQYAVQQMAEEVLATLHTLDLSQRWLLAGHSMGGKVAGVVARSLADTPSLRGLGGLIFVSASPPGPEPMSGSKRAHMLATLGRSTGDRAEDRRRAEAFVDDNTGKLAIPAAARDRAVDDVLLMSRAAFTAWLDHGSREDLAPFVGVLQPPALVFAGTEDAALGPEAQRLHLLPHLAAAQLVELPRCGHLSPLERPSELVQRIADFALDLGLILRPPRSALSPAFQALLASDRTSPSTRAVMQARLASDDDPLPPSSLNHGQLYTLRALLACIIPVAPFDLAARMERSLIAAQGDGWRFDALPADALAWPLGLDSLQAASHRAHGVDFVALTPALQHEILQQAQAGKLGKSLLGTLHLGSDTHLFTADQMQRWFEDVRAEITRLYVADPRTLDRIGFSGFADEGGFTQIELNQRESFERMESTP